MLVINEDYEVSEETFTYKTEGDLFAVKLIKGEFADIIYTYGTVNVADEENDDGTLSITYDYEIRKGKERITENNRLEFERHISSVLESSIMNSLELSEKRYNDEIRNKDPEAPDRE